MGDLYCLIHSAEDVNIQSAVLIQAYGKEIAGEASHDIEWQIKLGGICWTIHELRQLLVDGLEAIPIAREWIPEMVADIRLLLDKL